MSDFLEPNLEIFLSKLANLSEDKTPSWGAMTAHQMIEHLSNSIDLSMGLIETKLSIPEENVPKAFAFLETDAPMTRGFKVAYAPENPILRTENYELALDEFAMKWVDFEEYYAKNKSAKHLHPVFGNLNHESWLRVHSKHFTHHFEQFGIR